MTKLIYAVCFVEWMSPSRSSGTVHPPTSFSVISLSQAYFSLNHGCTDSLNEWKSVHAVACRS